MASIKSKINSSVRRIKEDCIVGHNGENSFFLYINQRICALKESKRYRTAETYTSALNSFRKFRNGKDISIKDIDHEIMSSYESFLLGHGITRNTSSFYMRILRAVYNHAADNGRCVNNAPFRKVYTGIDMTIKRAVSPDVIRRLRDAPLNDGMMSYARDIFMFSFYTRGMSFIDIAMLRKSNLSNGVLSYKRRKTGRIINVRWEKCMEEILDRHKAPAGSPYLFDIIDFRSDERTEYKRAFHIINRLLKVISRNIGLECNITLYVARHSWANIAKNRNIPVPIISECLGHCSCSVTQIYLASFDNSVIDKANMEVINNIE